MDSAFRNIVGAAIEGIIKRADTLSCKLEREEVRRTTRKFELLLNGPQAKANPQNLGQTPLVQTVTNLISISTNPLHLVRMAETYIPWF